MEQKVSFRVADPRATWINGWDFISAHTAMVYFVRTVTGSAGPGLWLAVTVERENHAGNSKHTRGLALRQLGSSQGSRRGALGAQPRARRDGAQHCLSNRQTDTPGKGSAKRERRSAMKDVPGGGRAGRSLFPKQRVPRGWWQTRKARRKPLLRKASCR